MQDSPDARAQNCNRSSIRCAISIPADSPATPRWSNRCTSSLSVLWTRWNCNCAANSKKTKAVRSATPIRRKFRRAIRRRSLNTTVLQQRPGLLSSALRHEFANLAYRAVTKGGALKPFFYGRVAVTNRRVVSFSTYPSKAQWEVCAQAQPIVPMRRHGQETRKKIPIRAQAS